MAYIELRDIDVSYDGHKKILDKLSLDVEEGQLVSLLGPSGCGKTTTLRVLGGFIQPGAGNVFVKGKEYTNTPIHKRNFGIVFQSYALFPHMTVADNIAFGLKMRHIPKSEMGKRVQAILQTVDLPEFGKRYPRELSGGQRQRVALARALVVGPELLLLDEPLSNLDAKLRLKMRVEIRELQQKMGITSVFVTHDQEECFSISDKVAVMNDGVIEQYDSPETIYARPKTEFVARFVGFENFFKLHSEADGYYGNGIRFAALEPDTGAQKTRKGTIRPEDIVILRDGTPESNVIEGRIAVRTYLGKVYQYKINTPFGDLIATDGVTPPLAPNDKVRLHFPKDKLIVV